MKSRVFLLCLICVMPFCMTETQIMESSYISGFCPTINATECQEILVAAGIKKAIRVKVHITDIFIQVLFVCQFNIEGRVTSVKARLQVDTIYCEEMEFSYTSRASNITVPFAIWGGSKPLDNPNNIHLVIYRCRDMADNCDMCQALPSKYNCGWCQTEFKCEIKDQCDHSSGMWLNCNEISPNPEIKSVGNRVHSTISFYFGFMALQYFRRL